MFAQILQFSFIVALFTPSRFKLNIANASATLTSCRNAQNYFNDLVSNQSTITLIIKQKILFSRGNNNLT